MANSLSTTLFGGNQSQSQLPSWAQPYVQSAYQTGQNLVNTPFTPYTGQAVAPLSAQEQQAGDLATQRANAGPSPFITAAQSGLSAGVGGLPSVDLSKYINPYVQGALEPAANDLRTQYYQQQNANKDQAIGQGAFGGSRESLLEGQTQHNYDTALANLYAQGYGNAYNLATQNAESDLGRQLTAAQTGGQLQQVQNQTDQQTLNNLMSTGQNIRGVGQAQDTFNVGQYQAQQQWTPQQLANFANVLGSAKPGSVGPNPNAVAETLGLLTSLNGLMGGGTSLLNSLGLGGGSSGGGLLGALGSGASAIGSGIGSLLNSLGLGGTTTAGGIDPTTGQPILSSDPSMIYNPDGSYNTNYNPSYNPSTPTSVGGSYYNADGSINFADPTVQAALTSFEGSPGAFTYDPSVMNFNPDTSLYSGQGGFTYDPSVMNFNPDTTVTPLY